MKRATSPCITTRGAWCVDTDQLLASGAMEGPFRKPRAVTRGWLVRLLMPLAALFRRVAR